MADPLNFRKLFSGNWTLSKIKWRFPFSRFKSGCYDFQNGCKNQPLGTINSTQECIILVEMPRWRWLPSFNSYQKLLWVSIAIVFDQCSFQGDLLTFDGFSPTIEDFISPLEFLQLLILKPSRLFRILGVKVD